MAYGAPTAGLDVTVANPSGKVVYKGQTSGKGTFGTGTLPAGQYVVQFNSRNAALNKGTYTMVVSAGKKKVSAEAVEGSKLAKGGIAMKIDVAGGMNVAGQVAESEFGGKPGMVYIGPKAGSHMGGHWVPKGSPEAVEAQTSGRMRAEDVQKITEKSFNPQG